MFRLLIAVLLAGTFLVVAPLGYRVWQEFGAQDIGYTAGNPRACFLVRRADNVYALRGTAHVLFGGYPELPSCIAHLRHIDSNLKVLSESVWRVEFTKDYDHDWPLECYAHQACFVKE